MSFSPLVFHAVDTAARLHNGLKRKAEPLPYIVHPFSVALILTEHTVDEEIIIAGILHDTIEDTGYTKEEMEKEFGSRVTRFVLDVTEPPKTFSWEYRKKAYLRHLPDACFEAKLICAADKLDNLRARLTALRKYGTGINQSFNATRQRSLWFYEETVRILQQDNTLPEKLLSSLEGALRDLRATP